MNALKIKKLPKKIKIGCLLPLFINFFVSIHQHLATCRLGSCKVTFRSSLTVQSHARHYTINYSL